MKHRTALHPVLKGYVFPLSDVNFFAKTHRFYPRNLSDFLAPNSRTLEKLNYMYLNLEIQFPSVAEKSAQKSASHKVVIGGLLRVFHIGTSSTLIGKK